MSNEKQDEEPSMMNAIMVSHMAMASLVTELAARMNVERGACISCHAPVVDSVIKHNEEECDYQTLDTFMLMVNELPDPEDE